ncbi:Copia protein [Porphyridium purpureum]|uniref:Copia protein n=1 Tax=Porphyridium purpureum TaxID=35688 RepID=A0A5J4YIZ2_PORPP|nr:Copia protein [Porphyridium purpureum]|eukprot:POR8469..scf210_14
MVNRGAGLTDIHTTDGCETSPVLYVDDGLIAGRDAHVRTVVKEHYEDFVTDKRTLFLDDGEQIPHLGMIVTRENTVITLDGSGYVRTLVKEHEESASAMDASRPMDYPEASLFDEPGRCECVREVIGKLMWVARTSRPSIAFTVAYLARFVDAWNEAAEKGLAQLLRYLRAHPFSQISFGRLVNEEERRAPVDVHVFWDVDHAGYPPTRRSTTGYAVYVRSERLWTLVDWSSRKQKVVDTSTGQAELISLHEATFGGFLPAMSLVEELVGTERLQGGKHGVMHCDIEVAIVWVCNGYSAKVEHLRKSQGVAVVSLYEVFAAQLFGRCELRFVAGKENPAGIFTKPLGPQKFREAVVMLDEPEISYDSGCTDAREELRKCTRGTLA